tara:strand:- start:10612 stop:12198 length:1587 start_codon:yes stop_codon:yes gene_type:complete
MNNKLDFELPKGWIIAKLSDMVIDPKSDFVDGPFGSNLKANEYTTKGVPVFKIQNIKAGYFLDKNIQYVTSQKAEQIKRHSFKLGDIIITKLGEPLGLCCKVPNKYPEGIIVADLMRVRPSNLIVDTDYLVYAINSKIIQDQFKSITKGTTRSRVNLTIVRDIKIPIAPLNEQKKIVFKLEELLSELEKGNQQLKIVLDQVIVYKKIILKNAFNGNLNKIDKNKWKNVISGDILDIRDGTHDTPKYVQNSKIPLITSKNLKDGEIDFSNVKYISKEDYINISKRSEVNIGDILFAMIGTIGNPVIIKKRTNFSIKNVGLFKSNPSIIIPQYLKYYLESPLFEKQIEENKFLKGSTQKFIPLGNLRKILIPLPPINEQLEIVNIIESIFSYCDNIEKSVNKALKDAENLQQSILQRAFEGRLVKQELHDESANTLLEKIIREREYYLKNKKTNPIYIKTLKMAEPLKSILELLKENKEPMAANILWQLSKHKDDIEAFYEQLKIHVEKNEIKELPRKGKESYLTILDKK